MKEKEIIEIVEDRFKTIHKLSGKIIKEFGADDIHDFRVEVKKLRAFLRLAAVEKEIEGPLIPKALKTFYGYIGIVRNIQLQRHNIFKYITNNSIDEPTEYIEILDKEKSYWQKEAEDLMEENDLKNDEEKIIKHLPQKLEKSSIKTFINSKIDALNDKLKITNNDENIHNIRKILKDILYNYNIIQQHANLPGIISRENNLKTLTAKLGEFRDKCVAFELLQDEYLHKIKNPDEQIRLLQIKNSFENDKKIMKEQLHNSLKALQV